MAWDLAVGVSHTPTNPSSNDPIQPFSSFRPPLREWVRGQGRLHGRTPVPSAAASDRGAVWRIRSTWPSQQLRSRLTPPKWAKKGPHRESPHWASNNSLVNPCPYTLDCARYRRGGMRDLHNIIHVDRAPAPQQCAHGFGWWYRCSACHCWNLRGGLGRGKNRVGWVFTRRSHRWFYEYVRKCETLTCTHRGVQRCAVFRRVYLSNPR